MTHGAAFRGQPLLLLAGLLVGWMMLRVVLWQPPYPASGTERGLTDHNGGEVRAVAASDQAPRAQLGAGGKVGAVPSTEPVPLEPIVPPAIEPVLAPILPAAYAPAVVEPGASAVAASPRAVIGHNLLLMAGMSHMQVPPALLAHLQGARPVVPGVPAAAPVLAAVSPRPAGAPSRWSADGWLLLRNDGEQGLSGPILSGRPSYGRSQAGAVIRYRLASESALRPQAYLRASAALAAPREQEVAAGLSVRPIPGLPLRIAAEARAGETARGARLRGAVFAVTEFPPLRLPLGTRGEVYAQGGYVGGEFATPFIDGQARVERPVARYGETEVSAGAGLWGGMQKGAARLDIGPTAAVSFRLGDTRGRVAADYRFRVAGDAEPSSGPALTLSAGF